METSVEPNLDKNAPKPQGKRVPVWVSAVAFLVLIGFLVILALALRRSQQGPITIGQTVPPIELNTFEGQVLNTQGMLGKVVVLNFWASWCVPCESEAAELQQAWEYYQPGGKVVFLGVDYVDTEPEAKEYLNKFKITYPNGPDLRTQISQAFRIRGVPETYLIDQNGKLVYAKIGPFESLDEIKMAINPLLK